MTNIEKIIKGIELCLSPHDPDCNLCPYDSIDLRCRAKLCDDIMTLLKEQEPRVLTIEEITGDGECWFEGINGACGYADCYMCTGSKEVELHRISMKPEYVSWDDFGKKWRCWSYRPTDEQRKAVRWG